MSSCEKKNPQSGAVSEPAQRTGYEMILSTLIKSSYRNNFDCKLSGKCSDFQKMRSMKACENNNTSYYTKNVYLLLPHFLWASTACYEDSTLLENGCSISRRVGK